MYDVFVSITAMYKGSGFKAAEDVALLRMVRKVEGQMEYSGVCQGNCSCLTYIDLGSNRWPVSTTNINSP